MSLKPDGEYKPLVHIFSFTYTLSTDDGVTLEPALSAGSKIQGPKNSGAPGNASLTTSYVDVAFLTVAGDQRKEVFLRTSASDGLDNSIVHGVGIDILFGKFTEDSKKVKSLDITFPSSMTIGGSSENLYGIGLNLYCYEVKCYFMAKNYLGKGFFIVSL